MPAMVFPRVALVRVHQTFGGCWYPSHIRHNETTAFTKNPPPFRQPGECLGWILACPRFQTSEMRDLDVVQRLLRQLAQHRDRAQDVGCHLLDRSRGCPPVGATWPTR